MYGLRHIPLKFYKHLRQGLESRVFVKSEYDYCLFMNGGGMVLVWFNVCIFYFNADSAIEKLIYNLKEDFCWKKKKTWLDL